MQHLGNGLFAAKHWVDALSVKEAEFSMLQRTEQSASYMLSTQENLATAYELTGRLDQCLQMRQDIYSRRLVVQGEENIDTLYAANNYAATLFDIERVEEAKSLLKKTMRVARRILGESHIGTLKMQWLYARTLYEGHGPCYDIPTFDDLHEAVTTLEKAARISQRVLGGAHPLTAAIKEDLGVSQDAVQLKKDLSG